MKALGPDSWGLGAAACQHIERARARGVRVFADQYPYDASSTSLAAALVSALGAGGRRRSLAARLADPELARRADRRDDREPAPARRRASPPDRALPPDRTIEGRTLAAIADARGLDHRARGARSRPSAAACRSCRSTCRRATSTSSAPALDDDVERRRAGADGRRRAASAQLRRVHAQAGALRARAARPPLEAAVHSMTGLPPRSSACPTAAARGRRGGRRGGFRPAAVRETATYTQPHQLAEGMCARLRQRRARARERRVHGGEARARAPSLARRRSPRRRANGCAVTDDTTRVSRVPGRRPATAASRAASKTHARSCPPARSPSTSNIPRSTSRTRSRRPGRTRSRRLSSRARASTAAGTVAESDAPGVEARRSRARHRLRLRRGTLRRLGALRARADDWVVRIPAALSTRDAMAIGTAGYTAAMCLLALAANGECPADGTVLVTGRPAASAAWRWTVRGGGLSVCRRAPGSPSATNGCAPRRGRNRSSREDVTGERSPSRAASRCCRARWAAAVDNVGGSTLDYLTAHR